MSIAAQASIIPVLAAMEHRGVAVGCGKPSRRAGTRGEQLINGGSHAYASKEHRTSENSNDIHSAPLSWKLQPPFNGNSTGLEAKDWLLWP